MSVCDAAAITGGWLHAFDVEDQCKGVLRRKGFSAFDAYRTYIRQFATCEEDVLTHEICRREESKMSCSRRFSGAGAHKSKLYRSEQVSRLADELAVQAGFPNSKAWLNSHPPPRRWDAEPDPLLRAQSAAIRLNSHNQLAIDHFNDMLESALQLGHEAEAARYGSEVPGSFLDVQQRFGVFVRSSASVLGKYGFNRVKTKAGDYAAFEKFLTKPWCLRWSINENDDFFTAGYPAFSRPTLQLRHSSFKGICRVRDSRFQVIEFPYYLLVEGLQQAYTKYRNMRELQLNLAAFLTVAEWALPHIEKSILNVIK